MEIIEKLPCDLKSYVYIFYESKFNACLKIQKCYRNYKFRHCRKGIWKELLQLLSENLHFYDIELLSKRKWIRNEWTTEPDSWIYMLKHEPYCLTEILDEIKYNQF